MATSTMIENIKVNNPKVLEDYVAVLEASEKAAIIPLKIRLPKELRFD